MFGKSLKSVLAAAVIATGAALAATGTANAGSSFGVYIGGGHGGIYLGKNRHHGHRYHGHRYHRKYHRNHHRGYGHCGPRSALRKAWHMGLKNPHVDRINHQAIAVVGYHYGHRAKVVFLRANPDCRVIKTRGLRRY